MQNMTSGIYKITNNITGDFYIGSSKNIKHRWAVHKCVSAWKLHPNSKLYKDMAQYGRDNFTIEVIEETDNLKKREQYWIEQLNPSYNNYRANGIDIERYKETHRRFKKEWNEIHRDERLAYSKAYRQAHRDECLARMKDWHKANRIKHLDRMKAYRNKLCLYEGEILTLNALSARFYRQGIAHAMLEAKNYLL